MAGPERTAPSAAREPTADAVSRLSPHAATAVILRLQRSAGNRAVTQLLERGGGRVSPDVAGERVGRAIGSASQALGDSAHLHTDGAAQKLTSRLGVPAVAVGSHVFASAGVSEDILGHELVHVDQARREPSVRVTLEPVRRAAAEREACAPTDGAVREGGLVHYYGEAGHFYTAYLVALAVGFDDRTAFRIAFYTQMPDEVSELDATHMAIESVVPVLIGGWGSVLPRFVELEAVRERDAVQRGGHALTGRPSAEERARRSAVTGTLDPHAPEFGLSVHALGDSFAHSTIADEGMMYQPVSGHAAQFVTDAHSPDYISLRRTLYVTYVTALYRAFVAAAASWPEHHITMLMKDEEFVTDLAREVARLPEDEQIEAIRALAAERLGRPMDRYAPENVSDRPFTEFADDAGPGAGNAGLETFLAGQDVTLEHAQAFHAWQASTLPAPVVPESGPFNLSGLTYDVFQAAAAEAARSMRDTRLELEAEMRQFFQSEYGYGF